MSIEKMVEQALQDGYLTQAIKAEIERICDNTSLISNEEYIALDRLMGALLTGEVLDDDNTGGSSPTPSPRRPGPTPGSYDSAELPIVAAVRRSDQPCYTISTIYRKREKATSLYQKKRQNL